MFKIDNQEDFNCICSHGYTGQLCEVALNPCDSKEYNKCSNNSKCIHDSEMKYSCKCDTNYYGRYCEYSYKPCRQMSNPCNELTEQGVCINMGTLEKPDAHNCTCSPMYTGKNCEIKLEEKCSDLPCNKFDKNATCIELRDEMFACKCSTGFEGPLCTNIEDCKHNFCQNGGKCIDGINSFSCDCDGTNFKGKFCETSKTCTQCSKDGTLYCDSQKPECVCKSTHQGNKCEIALDPCLNNPCMNGECTSNKINEYKCLCKVGFKGNIFIYLMLV